MSTARQPTPPVAPVTTTGPLSGVVPLRASASTASAAVKPAVPIAIASNVVSASGIRTTQADGTRA